MDEKKRSIDEIKPLAETVALPKEEKYGNEGKYEEESDDAFAQAPSLNRTTVKGDNSSAASASSNPPTAEEIAAFLQSSPEAFFHQFAATFLETGVDDKDMMRFLQPKSDGLPMSVIAEHVLPLLDRVSRNRLCTTCKELHAVSRTVNQSWPFKRRLHDGGGEDENSVAFSPDSELLASAGDDGIIRIWDRACGRCADLEGHTGAVRSVHFSTDGKLLASAGEDATIRLWKLEDRSFRVLEGHGSKVVAVAFSRDGSTLVSAEEDGGICLWDVDDGKCFRELVDESFHQIYSVAFGPDGETIATVGARFDEGEDEQGLIVLWDISDADDISSTTVETHDGTVYSLEYSPDARYFASGDDNATIRLWNVATNSCAMVMEGNSPVFSFAFAPNGKMMASGSNDGTVRLWRVEDGDGCCLVNLLGHHKHEVYSVAFSPDGQTLASCGGDGTVHLWNPHDEDRKQFKQVDWETVFLLWNFGKD
jgi:WD40 repeat protein